MMGMYIHLSICEMSAVERFIALIYIFAFSKYQMIIKYMYLHVRL